MTETFRRWPLFASLIAYFVLTAALIAVVPPNGAPDEAAHWLYVEHIATVGNLPVFNGKPPAANPGYEFHQPPLYYLVCAPLWKLTGAGVQNYACRVVSMLCGLATIWVIWAAAKLVFPTNWRIAAVAAFFAALLPLHQATGAGANNDAMGGLICAALFYLMARLWIDRVTWRDVWQLGVVVGLGIITKNTTLSVAAASFVVLVWGAAKSENEKAPRPVMAFGAAFAIAMLIGGPVLLRNQLLYGDVLAQKIFNAAFQGVSPGLNDFAMMGVSSADYARKIIFIAFCTFWGFFGGANSVIDQTHLFKRQPSLPSIGLIIPMLACVFAPLLALKGLRNAREQEDESPLIKSVRTSWGIGTAFVLLAWVQFASHYFAGGQARYGHAALLPLAVLLAVGWVGFWGRGKALAIASTLFGLVLVSLTLLNVLVWKTLV